MNRAERRRLARMEKEADGSPTRQRGVNVTICVPCHSDVTATFAYDLAQLMNYTASRFVKPGIIDNLGVGFQIGTYVHAARMQLALAALKQESDYILFIDSDMRFPPDALVKLLTHQEAMVGVNYVARRYPPRYIAVKTISDPDSDYRGELLETHPDSEGLEEAAGLGFGMVLIRRDVFEALPPPKANGPWWWFEWMPRHGAQFGEDIYFCRLVTEAGFKMYVDHDLSKQIKHEGHEAFSLQHAWAADALNKQNEAKQDGGDNGLHVPDSGDSGRSEQDGPDGDDSGVRAESGGEPSEGRPGEAAGGSQPPLSLVRGDGSSS